MDKVPGYATIANVVAAAGVTVGGGTDGKAVTNIVKGIVKVKRDYEDLSYNPAAYWEITDGANTAKLLWNEEIGRYVGVLDKLKYSVETYKESIGNTPVPQYKYYLYISQEPNFPGALGVVSETFSSRQEFTSFTFYDVTGILKQHPADALALKSEIPTEEKVKETVVQTVREANGGVWDQKLEVWWTPKMENGKLTYQATTNVNIQAEN
jgi:hypothetical protein